MPRSHRARSKQQAGGSAVMAGPAAMQQIEDGRPVSDVLSEIADKWTGERITLGDFVDLFGDRGHGLLMLILCLPNVVPIYIPGLSAVTGLPLAALGVQMAMGMRHPWLPGFLLRRSMAIGDLRRVVDRAKPWLRPVERVVRPRAEMLARGTAKRLMAATCVILALLLSTPLPFTNMVFATPIAVFALGVVQRDGIAVAVAAVASVVGVASVLAASWTLIVGALAFLGL